MPAQDMEIAFHENVPFPNPNTRTGYAHRAGEDSLPALCLWCDNTLLLGYLTFAGSMLVKFNHKLLIQQITLGAALLVLAACGTTTPTPDPDGPRLVGFDTLPKAMATIGESPTPD